MKLTDLSFSQIVLYSWGDSNGCRQAIDFVLSNVKREDMHNMSDMSQAITLQLKKFKKTKIFFNKEKVFSKIVHKLTYSNPISVL